ncbi:expressed unknown protein [Seminavis robusta]|uniref:Mechanosensitive ion channel MscS domain-containing protein n=1 Tax=Seminavis robusta TaxID=568900 RepID=A0A9N8HA22_9STRA|nr:expressed unknown protein [Seminavis robusta]|eukprot:Sro211_g087810.1 n/a (606) ;mRNA; f:4435-6252
MDSNENPTKEVEMNGTSPPEAPTPSGDFTPVAPRGGRAALVKRASAFFFGFDQEEEDEEVYHDHALSALTSFTAGESGDENKKSGVSQRSRGRLAVQSSTISPFKSVMSFGFNTKALIFCLIWFAVAFLVPGIAITESQIWQNINDPDVLFEFVTTVCVIPAIWIFMVWAAARVIRSGFNENNEGAKSCWARYKPSRTAFLMLLCITIELGDAICREIVYEDRQDMTQFLIDRALAFSMFAFWTSLLDDGVVVVQQFATKAETAVKAAKKTQKWKGFMKDMSHFGDKELDRAYAIPGGSRSPARVLADVIGVYATLGKAIGFVFLFLYMVGVDLYSSLVTLGVSVLFVGLIQSLHINDALSNLLPIAIGNAFHLGEIVSVSSAGGAPGDNPSTCLTGFVEGITWSHVVIRDFKRKQVFIPHNEMTNMSIYNWSRRPSKMISCTVTFNITHGAGGPARVSALRTFIKNWVKKHQDIEQKLYSKVALEVNSEGQAEIEIVCYHNVTASSKKVKAEIGIMIMEAAKRMQLCLVHPLLLSKEPWMGFDTGSATKEDAEVEAEALIDSLDEDSSNNAKQATAVPTETLLADLMPSQGLSELAGTAKAKKA